jgi:hypothetical protein
MLLFELMHSHKINLTRHVCLENGNKVWHGSYYAAVVNPKQPRNGAQCVVA